MTYTNTTKNVDLTADVIDVRDIIARVEAIESEVSYKDAGDFGSMEGWLDSIEQTLTDTDPETLGEYRTLRMILNDLEGNGGDEQFRGEWYPVTLIADHYFTAYAREMLADCGVIPADLPGWVEIDWQSTADNVSVDYSTVTIQGREYMYR